MILVALGANLPGRYGTAHQELVAAVQALNAAGIHVIKSSRLWLTAPMYVENQPWFHNAVVAVETSLSPYALLEKLHDIEIDFGRVRTLRNGPRVLDLDLIAYNDIVIDKPELIVPHPRMEGRAFVLKPMADITPLTWQHPLTGKTLESMLAVLPEQDAKISDEVFP